MLFLATLLGLVLLAGLFIATQYNRLVTLKGRYENAFAQIAVQLKRRYDLIPNLVETAQGYLSHEKETLSAVTQARNEALAGLQVARAQPGEAAALATLSQAEGRLGQALAGFSLKVEAYPELKANETMAQLSEELASTENRIAFARQAFNDAVTLYNIQRRSFPTVLLATTLGHPQDASLLEIPGDEHQAPPKVSFH
ncbi:LemA family protein [Pseudaeromonas paramecii]|uniref:LemA family protein n=1 Tax=Pseudaeromonas paramecii TaxID=2138166 RepID=A0ABP8QHT3_9GAMM